MLEPKGMIDDNIFNVINDPLTLTKTRQYDRTEKKNFTCFPCFVLLLFQRTKVECGLLTLNEILLNYFTSRAYCLKSVVYNINTLLWRFQQQ